MILERKESAPVELNADVQLDELPSTEPRQLYVENLTELPACQLQDIEIVPSSSIPTQAVESAAIQSLEVITMHDPSSSAIANAPLKIESPEPVGGYYGPKMRHQIKNTRRYGELLEFFNS